MTWQEGPDRIGPRDETDCWDSLKMSQIYQIKDNIVNIYLDDPGTEKPPEGAAL